MNDPKLITFLAAAVLVGLYMAWDAGVVKWVVNSFRPPWWDDKPTTDITAASAFAAAELLVRYYEKRQCLEGSRAAKAAAAHLLDCPGGGA